MERPAFPSVHWALGHEREAAAGAATPFSNPADKTGDLMPGRRWKG